MKYSEWIIGTVIGIVSGLGLHRLREESSVYNMKYQRKKATLFATGKAQYNRLQMAKTQLQSEAKQNIS